ncbi:unknown [[Mannheimia] succiniciproducens MBEL55E]|uniref:Uncharacterized protein n=1 Tax=Mannheimia succiniciproducens (strain KCTC 0769BP / MBEL55E) TaxID=221988 RepID=Q65UV0_MANSM|nr:unknown [[Mannheimia] succiniciproducens MBEL55E]
MSKLKALRFNFLGLFADCLLPPKTDGLINGYGK